MRVFVRTISAALIGLASLLANGAFAATGTIGTGTPQSCTGNGLAALIGQSPTGGTITFDCGGLATVTLDARVVIGANTTIDGGHLVTIDGGSAVNVFTVNSPATLTLERVVVAHGSPDADCNYAGGGVCVNAGATLVANNARFEHNFGITGGAIQNYGTATLNQSTVYANTAADTGGGIENDGGTLTLNATSIIANDADGEDDDGFVPPHDPYGGGGLRNAGTTTIVNSTFASNFTYWGVGGAIRNDGKMTLSYSTIAFNGAGPTSQANPTGRGGAIQSTNFAHDSSIAATIVFSNTNGNCDDIGSLASLGYNLTERDCPFAATGDAIVPSLTLAAQGNFGGPNVDPDGPLIVIQPGAGNAALDKIPNGTLGCGTTVTTDERGLPRAVSAKCDIGAVEVQTAAQPTTGTVTVYTYLEGPEAGSVPTNTQYSVSLTCGTTTLPAQNITAGGSTVFHSVPTGICTLSENTANLPVIAGVLWAPPTYLPQASLLVNGGDNTNATVVNRASGDGIVVVKSQLAGAAYTNGLISKDSVPFTYTLTCGPTILSLDIPVGDEGQFNDVPAGSCTLAGGPKFGGYSFTFDATTFAPSGALTVVKNQTQTIHATIHTDLLPNSVAVFAKVTGNATQSVGNVPYQFTLTCGAYTSTSNASPISPWVFTNVPVGSCALTQLAFPYPGVTFGAPTFSPSANFTMTANGAAVITATETATFTPNVVAVFNDVVGPAANHLGPGDMFTIKLTCGGTALTQSISGFSFAIFNNVPPGACSLSETLPTVSGIVWGTPNVSPPFTMTAGANHQLSVINTANSSVLTTGTIDAFIDVTGSAVNSVSFDAPFSVSVVCGNNAPINVVASRNKQPTFSGLPPGPCSIAVGSPPPIAGVAWSAPTYYPSRTATVIASATALVNINFAAQVDAIFKDDFE